MTEAQTNHIQRRVTALRSEAFCVAEDLRQTLCLEDTNRTEVEALARLQSVANMLGQVESLLGGPTDGQGLQAEELTIAA